MPEFIRGQPRRKPGKSLAFYAQWGRDHDVCAACGISGGALSTHHIVKQGRAHEACNLLRLCGYPCHTLAEGLDVWHGPPYRIPPERFLLPKITLGIALSLKLRCDPDEMDLERLQELRGSALPELAEIPRHFVDIWRRNREVPG